MRVKTNIFVGGMIILFARNILVDYGGLIRAHINHTSTCTEEVVGIIGYGVIKVLGWRARLGGGIFVKILAQSKGTI